MPKKKIKTEYIVLAAIIIVSCLLLLLRNPNKINYEIPKMNPIDKSNITRIEIIKPSETLSLQQKNGKWTIGPEEYTADEYKTNSITDAVKDFTLSTLISEAENYSLYDLNEDKRILVKAYNGEELLREFTIGKDASTYRHTYVLIKGDKRVYHALNAFRNDFDQELDNLRDKKVMKFEKDEISEVEIVQTDSRLRFIKDIRPVEKTEKTEETEAEKAEEQGEPQKPETEEFWFTEDGIDAANTELNPIITQCADLDCQEYIYGKTKQDFVEEPILKITLKGAAKDYILTVFEKSEEDDNNHPAFTSESPYPFFLGQGKVNNLNKKPEDLLKKEGEDNK